MEKNEVKKEDKVSIDLTKKEVDNLSMRQQIINNKVLKMQELDVEIQLLKNENKIFIDKLLIEHKLDPSKKYKIDNGTLQEE